MDRHDRNRLLQVMWVSLKRTKVPSQVSLKTAWNPNQPPAIKRQVASSDSKSGPKAIYLLSEEVV